MLSSSLFTLWKLQLLKIALAQILFWARQSTNAQTALSSASSAGFESSGVWVLSVTGESEPLWTGCKLFLLVARFLLWVCVLSEIGLSSWHLCQSTWQAFDDRCSDEVMESLPFPGHPSGWIWQLRFPSFYWDSSFPKHHTFGMYHSHFLPLTSKKNILLAHNLTLIVSRVFSLPCSLANDVLLGYTMG